MTPTTFLSRAILVTTILLLCFALPKAGHAQTEHLVEYDDESSLFFGKLLDFPAEDKARIYVAGKPFKPDGTPGLRRIHGGGPQFKRVITIDTDNGDLLNSEKLNRSYGSFMIHDYEQVGESSFLGISFMKTRKQVGTYEDGKIPYTMDCKKIIVGIIDTSTMAHYKYKHPDCNYDYIHSSMYSDDKYYVLYKHDGNVDYKVVLLELSNTLQLLNSYTIDDRLSTVMPMPGNSGFYAFSLNPEDESEQRLATISTTGSVDYISSYMDMNVDGQLAFADFIYDGTFIYAYMRGHSVIRKFNTDGELVDSYSTGGFHFAGWELFQDHLVVFHRAGGLKKDNSVKVTVFDSQFDVTGEHVVGFPSVGITDYRIDRDNYKYYVVGTTNHHYRGDEGRDNDKLYYLEGSLVELMSFESENDRNDSFYFPNPNEQDKVYLQFDKTDNVNLDGSVQIEFIDAQGKHLQAGYKVIGQNLLEIETKNLSKGVYIGIARQNGEIISSRKLIVK